MATARIVELTLDPPAGTTHFNIRFKVPSASSWTDFFTTGATLEDLAVGLLVSNVYTLNGVNTPAGNAAIASEAGTRYEVRYKATSTYGNWSDPLGVTFKPDDDGPLADVAALQDDFLDYKIALDFSTQEDADRQAGRWLNDAMRFVRMRPAFDTLYTGSRTQAQADGLRLLERRLAMWTALRQAARMKALGMHAPLLMEESVDILAVATDLKEEIDEMMTALLDVEDAEDIVGGIETGLLILPEREKSPWSQYLADVEYVGGLG
jgi:hypothetical protein